MKLFKVKFQTSKTSNIFYAFVIAEYKSAREAWKQTGISDTTIGLVCKGKGKTAGGFIWRYKNY